jgi:hypothetical protein
MLPDLLIFVISVKGEVGEAYAALRVLVVELYKHGRCVSMLLHALEMLRYHPATGQFAYASVMAHPRLLTTHNNLPQKMMYIVS